MTVSNNEILLVAVEALDATSPYEEAQLIADQLSPETDLSGELVLVYPEDNNRAAQTAHKLAAILPDCASVTLIGSDELNSENSQKPHHLKDMVGDTVIKQDDTVTVVALAGEQEVRELADPYAWLWADQAPLEDVIHLPVVTSRDNFDVPTDGAVIVETATTDATQPASLPFVQPAVRRKLEAVTYAAKPTLALYEFLFNAAAQPVTRRDLTLAS